MDGGKADDVTIVAVGDEVAEVVCISVEDDEAIFVEKVCDVCDEDDGLSVVSDDAIV